MDLLTSLLAIQKTVYQISLKMLSGWGKRGRIATFYREACSDSPSAYTVFRKMSNGTNCFQAEDVLLLYPVCKSPTQELDEEAVRVHSVISNLLR